MCIHPQGEVGVHEPHFFRDRILMDSTVQKSHAGNYSCLSSRVQQAHHEWKAVLHTCFFPQFLGYFSTFFSNAPLALESWSCLNNHQFSSTRSSYKFLPLSPFTAQRTFSNQSGSHTNLWSQTWLFRMQFAGQIMSVCQTTSAASLVGPFHLQVCISRYEFSAVAFWESLYHLANICKKKRRENSKTDLI